MREANQNFSSQRVDLQISKIHHKVEKNFQKLFDEVDEIENEQIIRRFSRISESIPEEEEEEKQPDQIISCSFV